METWSQTVKLTLENISNFLNETAARFHSLANRRDTSLGFNAFALVSDTYRKENFHSDIIAAILDPASPHGEGKVFLRLFLRHLEAVAKKQEKEKLANDLAKLSMEGQIEVKREEGRVDIKIEAPEWTIIIENKINGAIDMERQLPSYLEKCGGPKQVKAVVYLTAAEEKLPDVHTWTSEERKLIFSRLIRLVGFSETESIRNLVDGWLTPCEVSAKGFATRAVLAQYSELVRHEAGETMNQEDIKQLFSSLQKSGIAYTELLNALQEMPHTLAVMVAEKVMNRKRLQRVWLWKSSVAVLELEDIYPNDNPSHPVRLAFDIHCENLDEWGISLLTRTENEVPIQAYESLLQSFDHAFTFKEKEDRIFLLFDTNKAFGNVDAFINKVDGLVSFLDKHWQEFERIAGGGTPRK